MGFQDGGLFLKPQSRAHFKLLLHVNSVTRCVFICNAPPLSPFVGGTWFEGRKILGVKGRRVRVEFSGAGRFGLRSCKHRRFLRFMSG